jgi:hypothetical protein
VYGNLDETVRRALVAELTPLPIEEFRATALALVGTDGRVESWRTLATEELAERR